VPGTTRCPGFQWGNLKIYVDGEYRNDVWASGPEFNSVGAKHPALSSINHFSIGRYTNTYRREIDPLLVVFVTTKTVGGRERIVKTSSSPDYSSGWTRIENINFQARKDSCWSVRVSTNGFADLQNSFVVEHIYETVTLNGSISRIDPIRKKICERVFPEDFKNQNLRGILVG